MEMEDSSSPFRIRLRQQFEAVPKTAHGETLLDRHGEVQPEWVMMVMETPYDHWTESRSSTGERVDIFVGRVQSWHYWLKVVLVNGKLETAYSDWRLNGTYGGPPWSIQ